jgi:hypothetical protein
VEGRGSARLANWVKSKSWSARCRSHPPSLPSIVLASSTRVEEGYSAAYRDGAEGGRRGAVGQLFKSPREESKADVPMAGGENRESLAASKKGSAATRRTGPHDGGGRARGTVHVRRKEEVARGIFRQDLPPIVSACTREFEQLNHRNFISVRRPRSITVRSIVAIFPLPPLSFSLSLCPSVDSPRRMEFLPFAGPSSGIWRDGVLNWPGREWSVNRNAGGVEEDTSR